MADKTSNDKSKSKSKWEKFADSQDAEQEQAKVSAEASLDDDQELGIDYPSREELERKLTEMEQSVDEYKEKSLRIAAQLKNLQDRAERDISKAHKFGAEKLLNDLLPVLDSLVQGIESANSESLQDQGVITGMELTLDLFAKVLAKHGVEEINPERGAGFDPEVHEAMTMQPDPEVAPNSIVQVLQRGYALNGRVLRPARVIVAGG